MPESLVSLVEQGIIEDVVRPLMSGKEAQVYLVVAHGEQRVAKVYKEANDRTFRHRSEYTEGRKVRNTRDQRALSKRSQYGRSQQEATWRDTEAEVIYRLRDAGVRVPEPFAYVDNVLVMELVTDEEHNPAPRLADFKLRREQAEELFETLLREVVKMLCAGLVHGDLSEFNILAGSAGSVIIDFPQAVDPATNRNARKLLLRDVGNLTRFFGRYCRSLRSRRYGEELWDIYERGELNPDTILTGRFKPPNKKTELSSLLEEIEESERENRSRREALGLPPVRPARQPSPASSDEAGGGSARAPGRSRRRRRRKPSASKTTAGPSSRDGGQRQQRETADRAQKSSEPAKPRRPRTPRRRRGGGKTPRR